MPPKKRRKAGEAIAETASQDDVVKLMAHTKRMYEAAIGGRIAEKIKLRQMDGKIPVPAGLLTELTKRWVDRLDRTIENKQGNAFHNHTRVRTNDTIFPSANHSKLPPRNLKRATSGGSFMGTRYQPKITSDVKTEGDNDNDLDMVESPRVVKVEQPPPKPSAVVAQPVKAVAVQPSQGSDSDSDDGYDDALFTTNSSTTQESGLLSRYGEEIAAQEANIEPFDDLTDVNVKDLREYFATPPAGEGSLHGYWTNVKDKKDGTGFSIKAVRGAVLRMGGIEAIVSMQSNVEADFNHSASSGGKRKR